VDIYNQLRNREFHLEFATTYFDMQTASERRYSVEKETPRVLRVELSGIGSAEPESSKSHYRPSRGNAAQ